MKIKITVAQKNGVLHVAQCEVAQEGDIEKAVSDAMAEARKKSEFGQQWGFSIHVDKVSATGMENRDISAGVRKIKLSGAVDVVVKQGVEPKMEVFANDATDLSKILTTVSGDCLTIGNEPAIAVSLAGNGVTVVSARGGAQVAGGGIINSGNRVVVTLPHVTDLLISGAGNMAYQDVNQAELTLDVSGAGTIEVSGKVDRLKADVSGAGDILAKQLAASSGHLRVSGAGNIKALITTTVKARVSGVGKIKISGCPSERDTDVSGVGQIKFVDD